MRKKKGEEPALGRLPPARLGALCSAALLDNDGLVTRAASCSASTPATRAACARGGRHAEVEIGEPALGRLPPARLGALCSAALLDNDGLVDVLRREQRLDVVVVVAVVVIEAIVVL